MLCWNQAKLGDRKKKRKRERGKGRLEKKAKLNLLYWGGGGLRGN